MQTTLDFTAGIAAKNAGIKRAIDHANSDSPGWSERAYLKLIEYIKANKRFQAEDFRSWCAMVDFELPDNARAFGHVILRAAREFIIIKIGIAPVSNPRAHCANAALWERNDERLMEMGL